MKENYRFNNYKYFLIYHEIKVQNNTNAVVTCLRSSLQRTPISVHQYCFTLNCKHIQRKKNTCQNVMFFQNFVTVIFSTVRVSRCHLQSQPTLKSNLQLFRSQRQCPMVYGDGWRKVCKLLLLDSTYWPR